MGIKITTTGHYLPPHIVSNHDLTAFLDTSDEWIKKRTGISQRHISTGENTSELAAKAANVILEKRGITSEEIDFIILATMTPDASSPSTACLVQEKIGATNAFCFDINAACSGFVYALSTACHLMRSGMYKKGLVLGAETMSKIVNWEDRSTAVLFGDGAGGLLLEESETDHFVAEDLHSDGSRFIALTADDKKVTNPFAAATDDVVTAKQYLQMDGRGIFDFVIRSVPKTITDVVAKGNLVKEDIDWVVAHQANIRLLEAISKKVKLPLSKFASNIAETGNTSAASIPVLLSQMVDSGQVAIGDGSHILFTGFGGGLTWGSIIIKL